MKTLSKTLNISIGSDKNKLNLLCNVSDRDLQYTFLSFKIRCTYETTILLTLTQSFVKKLIFFENSIDILITLRYRLNTCYILINILLLFNIF